MAAKKNTKVLARVHFPLYAIQMISSRHIIVGGGGGSAKTGITNGFEIFEISHDGVNFIAEEVTRHDTGPSVVMNFATFANNKRTLILAGQESHCQLYSVETKVVSDIIENIGSESELRNRKHGHNNNLNGINKQLQFNLKLGDSVQSDFNGIDPLLRVIRIHHSGNIMVTGGTDGDIRLWKFPSLQLISVLKAHQKEIDDIDFSLYNNQLLSLSKDGQAILWDILEGIEIKRLTWPQPNGSKYLFKRCKFGRKEGKKSCFIYTLINPTGVTKKLKSYLHQWDADTSSIVKAAPFDESISALAVRNDGRFVAVGTMFSGSVAIFTAYNLQKILNVPEAHSMFITGLEFLPISSENHVIASIAEAAVMSISVDNQICIHTLPFRKTLPLWLGITIIILTIVLTFMFCSYIGI